MKQASCLQVGPVGLEPTTNPDRVGAALTAALKKRQGFGRFLPSLYHSLDFESFSRRIILTAGDEFQRQSKALGRMDHPAVVSDHSCLKILGSSKGILPGSTLKHVDICHEFTK